MHVAQASVSLLRLPLERPYRGAGGRTIDAYWIVLARVRTTDGVLGIGYIVMLQAEFVRAVVSAASEAATYLAGMHVLEPEAAWERMVRAARFVGPGGIVNYAIAPVDIALWDAAGKTLGQPLFQLLGGYRDRVDAYATDGFTHDLSEEELVTAARGAAAAGFTALKFRMGPARSAAEEVRRLLAIRQATGPGMRVLVEVAQGWDVARTLHTGRLLQEAGAGWIEDPIDHKNVEGLARIASSLEVPIATGENLYGLEDFARLFREKAVGVPIVDLGRIAGITPWRRVAALARVYGLPLCGHVLPEVQVHLLSAIPNGFFLEYAPRAVPILRGMPPLEGGAMLAPRSGGLGLELNEENVRRFTVAT